MTEIVNIFSIVRLQYCPQLFRDDAEQRGFPSYTHNSLAADYFIVSKPLVRL